MQFNHCAREGSIYKGLTKHNVKIAVGLSLFLLQPSQESQAEFNLNFIPDESGVSYSSNDTYVSCNMSYISSANCGGGWGGGNDYSNKGSHIDGTPFYQRMFRDSSNNWYYQVIVGDYTANDFALEYIIKVDGTGNTYDNSSSNIYRSSSAGVDDNSTTGGSGRLYNMTKPYDVEGSDPAITGTGTGNPTRVIMKQLVSDGEISMVYLKDTFANKPLMTQTIATTEMTSVTDMDLRAKDHNDLTPISAENFTNTVVLQGTQKNDTAGDYDYGTFVNHTTLTAGGYTYTSGTGYGGSDGTYNYADELTEWSFDAAGVDYASFCDPEQNPDWSGNGACTNSDATGGGRRGGWGW